jgi:hypothetical protein
VGFAYRIPGKHDTVIRGGGGLFYGPTVSNTIGDVASLGFSTSASYVASPAESQSALRLRDGFPAVSRPPLTAAFGAVAPGQTPNTAVAYFNPKQIAPISYQYNLNVQREISSGLLVEAGYLANISHHLTANDLSLDQVAPELMGAGNAQARRPFPQFTNVTWINPSIGNSTYHGGFLRAEKRFGGSFSFLAHYTFSKFIDDVESANEYGVTGSYMDAYNRRLDKGLSGSDVPHHLVLTLLYELPPLRGNRLLKNTLGGWKLGVLETAESGAPFTVITTANTTNAFPAGSLRPNLLRRPTQYRALVRYLRVRGSSAIHLRQFPPLEPARRAAGDYGCHAGKIYPVERKGQFRPARRILQHLEQSQFQRPRSHVWSGRFRSRYQRSSGPHRTISCPLELLTIDKFL